MKKIMLHTYGSVDVMEMEEHEIPQPSDTQVVVKTAAIGVNDLDLVVNITGQATLDNSYQVVKRGGKVTSVNGLPNPTLAAERDIEIKYSQGFMTIEELTNAVKLYAEGKLRLTIDKKYPFDLKGIKQAHHDFEYGHNKGKKIIVFK